MPSQVFKEMWSTIKSGHVWTGIVKNRSKNGDYYWVDATVTPIKESNQITGYVSVRKSHPGETLHAQNHCMPQ